MILTESLVEAVQALPPKNPLSNERSDLSSTAALFAEMDADEENDTPEQAEQGKREREAFRDALNETRAKSQARLIYL